MGDNNQPEIKSIYTLIMNLEEDLQKEKVSSSIKGKLNDIRNKFGNLFYKEIYEE